MRSILIILFFFLGNLVFSQDTVLVSTKNTSYILMPEGINYFDIGLPDNFAADIGQGMQNETELKDKYDNKMLKLKCIQPTQDISSLMVKFGDRYEMFYLKYVPAPKKFFYELYRDLNKNSENNKPVAAKPGTKALATVKVSPTTTLSAAPVTHSVSPEDIAFRCDSMLKVRNELREYGVIADYLQCAVTAIRNDKDNTYLKIGIKNSSSLPYKFDFISFQYVQKMNKGVGKSKRKAPTDVFPVRSPAMSEVPANKGIYVSYAIPSFGLANNGYLLVLFREKSGDRVLKIYIPSDIIQGSAYLK